MNWQATLEGTLAPADVLRLIRDGKASSMDELCTSMLDLHQFSPSIRYLAEGRLWEILTGLAEAGLVTVGGKKLAPTALIARIQRALQISLTELGEAWQQARSRDLFVAPSVIESLRQAHHNKYDLAKIVRFCEELNASYASGNYLASSLLIRALLNHVPPVFGHTTFEQVVNQSARSVKALLKPLDEILRDVADLHTQSLIRHKETLPTKFQIEPFKANLEVLLNEIIARVKPKVEAADKME
jgi:hypothetical protein